MSKILRLRRGNTAAHLTFTGKSAEVTVDTDKNTLVVHDNVTVGGHPIATESYVIGQGYITNSALTGYATESYVNSAINNISVNTGNYSFSGDHFNLPENARMNGGHFLTNAPEFGTQATVNVMEIMHSEIYMGAGTAETRAIVQDQAGHSLIYSGVENTQTPAFAGFVAADPNVTSQYSIGLDTNGNIILGAVQEGGTLTTQQYVAGVGVLNSQGTISGLLSTNDTVLLGNPAGIKLKTDRGLLALGTDMEFPGAPTHFHIAFDGSNSTAPASDLILGDDFNYFKLVNYGNGAVIGATDRNGGSLKEWKFNVNGSTILPGGVTVNRDSDGFIAPEVSNGVVGLKSYTGLARFDLYLDNARIRTWSAGFQNEKDWLFDQNGDLNLPSGGDIKRDGISVLGGSGFTLPPNTTFSDIHSDGGATIENTGGLLELYSNVGEYKDGVRIRVKGTGGDNSWLFKSTGTLTVPGIEDDSTAAIDLFAAQAGNHKFTLASDWTLKLKARADVANQGHLKLEAGQNTAIQVNGSGSNVSVLASDGTTQANYTFEKEGIINLPGGSSLASNGTGIDLKAGVNGYAELESYNLKNYIWVDDNGAYVKTNYNTNAQSWSFGLNGSLTFPDGTVQGTAWTGLLALSNLTDVDLTTPPSNGQVLKYDALLGHWAPAADLSGGGGGGLALTDLSAILDDTPFGSGNLTYNNATGVFTFTQPDLSNFLTSGALTGYATESYVTSRGYITSAALSGYATESYVTSQGYITNSALTGYATESYVTSQGYITSTISGNIGNANVIFANTFTSNVSTGTAPFTVNSTTQVANLNVAVAGSLVNGTSNVTIPDANGNINLSVNGNANVLVVTGTGANISGTANVTGNANVGNLGTNALVVSGNAAINGTGGITTTQTTFNVAVANATTVNIGNAATIVNLGNASSNVVVAGDIQINGNDIRSSTGNSAITLADRDVTIHGNLTVQGATTQVGSQNLTIEDSIINLHTYPNLDALTSDDGRDIGMVFHYFKTADKQAFLGWANDTTNLEYYVDGTESNGTFSGTYGSFRGLSYISTATTGTAPLVVNSTTQVANLNVATAGSLVNGTSNVVVALNSNVTVGVAGNAAVMTVTGTGANISGTANITGNANVGNLGTATAVITTGNITTINSGLLQNGTSNVAITNNSNVTVGVAGNAAILTVTGTGANISGTINATGNANVGNLGTATAIITTGNITTINSGLMQNGTSNIAITNNANITMGVAGNAAVMTVTGSNVNVTGNVVATADLWTGTGNLRTSSGTGNIFNFSATTINMGGAATTVNIGNASGVINLSGNVQGSTNGFAIGYRDIPQVSFTANATISTSDAGKHYYSTSASNLTFTIANNASQGFSIGAAINIVNQGTGNITIAQGSGVTLYMAGNSTSGNRTLSSYGVATVQKVTTDTWFVVGVGLS